MRETEFEIHFAAEQGAISDDLRRQIYGLGFRDDGLVGQGVVFSPNDPLGKVSCPLVGLHVTWECYDRDQYMLKREIFERVLAEQGGDCVGYAHAEVVRPEWDHDLVRKPFDATVRYPVAPFDAAPRATAKEWDIHISADVDSLDPGLCDVLFVHGRMYYIDVRKAEGRVVRVFTIQGVNSVRDGRRLFHALRDYLVAAGGMGGAIKYEETCFWATYGAPAIVPPVVQQVTFIGA